MPATLPKPNTSLDDALDLAKGLNIRLIKSGKIQTFKDFGAYLDFFSAEVLPARRIAQKTLREYLTRIPHLKNFFGLFPIEQISVNHVASFLNQFPPQQSNHYRTFLVFIFKHIEAQGLCQRNPAAVTLPKQIQVQRRALTESQFWAIHAIAPPFLQRAMELGLHTLLRREDICVLEFSQIREGFLWVTTHKTKAALKIRINQTLAEILFDCKTDGIMSPFVVHHQFHLNRLQNKKHATQVLPDYLTKEFSKARDNTGIFGGFKTYARPTFHEIRGLGAHLYERKGVPKQQIQALLGHSDPEMTERYLSKHAERYTEICLD